MPYDTRRKSLSLPSLGIQLPSTSRAHRPSVSKTSPTQERPSPPQAPPSKKVKRSHPTRPSSPTHTPRPRSSTSSSVTKNVSFAERPKSSGRNAYENTPPSSPEPSGHSKYDTVGISDEIVVGVIQQLEKTGNRPHMIKELATVLSSVSDAVSSSANPGALLSSRLAAYLKRPGWSPLSPCPIEKELTTVHPRKIYYSLTTKPRQPLPTDSSDLFTSAQAGGKGGKRIISPSISSASVDEDAETAEERKRDALSPSPEVDLSSHDIEGASTHPGLDFVTPSTPGPTFSGRSSMSRENSNAVADGMLSHSQRAASPPLENEERDFTVLARSVRMRGMSLDDPSKRPSIEITNEALNEDNDEDKANFNREAAEALFGSDSPQILGPPIVSSPLAKPAHSFEEQRKEQSLSKSQAVDEDVVMHEEPVMSVLGDSGAGLTWDTREPEDIQIEDLDDLFDSTC